MKTLCLFVAMLCMGLSLQAQNVQDQRIKELLEQGIALHDSQKYTEAIATYQAALALDKNSSMVHYELAYTYIAIKAFDKAIKHCKIAIEDPNLNFSDPYVALGNAWDLSGKTAKAIAAYEEGIARFPNQYLLHYNLALAYFNAKKYKKCEEAAINAIKANPEHGSSHLILADCMYQQGSRAKAILPLYYYLTIQPVGDRAKRALSVLKTRLANSISVNNDKEITINVSRLPDDKDEFQLMDISISLVLIGLIEKQKAQQMTPAELFALTNKGLFELMAEQQKGKSGFWWETYAGMLAEIANAGHTEAFSYFISQSEDSPTVKEWMDKNTDKLTAFAQWIHQQ